MDYTRIMQSLLTETNPMRNARAEKRRLLTFHDPNLYQDCISEWSRLTGRGSLPGSIRISPLTHTIIAPVTHTTKLEQEFRHDLMVEEDHQLHIHAVQGSVGKLTGIPWGIKQIKAPQPGQSRQGTASRLLSLTPASILLIRI